MALTKLLVRKKDTSSVLICLFIFTILDISKNHLHFLIYIVLEFLMNLKTLYATNEDLLIGEKNSKKYL